MSLFEVGFALNYYFHFKDWQLLQHRLCKLGFKIQKYRASSTMGNQFAGMCLGKQKKPESVASPLMMPEPTSQPLGVTDQQSKRLMNQNLFKMLSKRTNLFEGIIAPYRSQPRNEWVPVGQNLIYKGEWNKEGRRHGHGFLYDRKEQSLVVGCFSDNNLIPNKCRKIFSNETEYIGQLNQAYEMHGVGKVIGKKFTYEGQLKNNKFDGEGQLDRENIVFKGTFERGHKKKGLEITPQGTYEGPFEKDQREGQGVFMWNDGGRYEGTFSQNKMHGKGKLYDREGNFSGTHTFEEGKLLL